MDQNTLKSHIALGRSQREIASAENCSQATVKHYLAKYGLKTTRADKNRKRVCQFCGVETTRETASNRGKSVCLTVCKKCHYQKRIERYRKKKALAVAYKGGKCVNCGYDRCQAALTFHHRNPKMKDPQWKHMRSWSLGKIKKELDKCDLVCENCHREIHYGVMVKRDHTTMA